MKKTRVGKLLFAIMLVLMLALVACSNDSGGDAKGDGKEGKQEEKKGEKEDNLYSIDDFKSATSNTGEAIEGGEATFGLVTSDPFKGTLNWNFYDGAPDAEVIAWFDESLLDNDDNYNYTQDGAATYEVEDGRIFTFKIKDNVNWHDGEPVKAEDWAFAHEVIANPDYPGVRYDSSFRNIEGMEEYHNGEADSISGIEVIDEKTLKITYIKSTPSLLTGGIWPYALPKHIFKDIPVEKMPESDAVRKNPIGFGPFKVETIVPGESVVYSKYEDYWRGEPNLDKLTLKVVSPSTVVQELEKGTVDFVDSFPVDQFPDNANMSNVEFLGQVDLAYTYIGFKLGTWDKKEKKVKPNPDAKMGDVNLRRAMWYAVDNDAVGKKFYNGLRWAANTLIPPSHPAYHADDVEAPTFDPEKAQEILEEAGYKDTNDDGFRETPDGEELVINFASMSGGDTAEPLAKYYIQAWENVGLKVELLDGRLQEFETFYDRVGNGGNDDPKVDVYQGAWGVGSDVDPSGLYGQEAMFNFSRFASEENDRLLEEGLSEKAFDVEYRQNVYKEWQELMVEEVPVFPTLYRSVLVPVNNRITNWDIAVDVNDARYKVGVTEEKPAVAE